MVAARGRLRAVAPREIARHRGARGDDVSGGCRAEKRKTGARVAGGAPGLTTSLRRALTSVSSQKRAPRVVRGLVRDILSRAGICSVILAHALAVCPYVQRIARGVYESVTQVSRVYLVPRYDPDKEIIWVHSRRAPRAREVARVGHRASGSATMPRMSAKDRIADAEESFKRYRKPVRGARGSRPRLARPPPPTPGLRHSARRCAIFRAARRARGARTASRRAPSLTPRPPIPPQVRLYNAIKARLELNVRPRRVRTLAIASPRATDARLPQRPRPPPAPPERVRR